MSKLKIRKRKNNKKREQMHLQKALEERCNHKLEDLLSEEEKEILKNLLDKKHSK